MEIGIGTHAKEEVSNAPRFIESPDFRVGTITIEGTIRNIEELIDKSL
jgi:hypothetical protein